MATVILGTGIIGVSIAHYLSLSEASSTIHLVEAADELFSSASGFAAGFLAEDWFSGPMLRLARLSFKEHRDLAAAHGGAKLWGYRTGMAFSYLPSPYAERPAADRGDANWLFEGTSRAGEAAKSQEVAGAEAREPAWLLRYPGDQLDCISANTVGQVDPARLCHFLLKQCLDRGVHLHHPAAAISVRTDDRGELASIRIADTKSSTETDVPCTRVIIAAGAWSPRVFAVLFPSSNLTVPVASLAGHSLLFRSPRWKGDGEGQETGSRAVFMSQAGGGNAGWAPEAFSWADGTIYLAGLNDAGLPLPRLASDAKAQISAPAMARMKEAAREMFGDPGGDSGDGGGEDGLEFVREALCFRPVTPTGTPIISRVPDELLGGGMRTRAGAEGGVFVVAGHGPWGINLSLGTGKAAAEMIQRRPCSIGDDMGFFDIRRVLRPSA